MKFLLPLLFLLLSPAQETIYARFKPSSGPCNSVGTPVECWLTNEGSGFTLHTSSATGNDLTAASNTTWSIPTGGGLSFAVPSFSTTGGIGGAVGANQTSTNFDGSTPFTVCVWTNFAQSGTALIGTLNTAASFLGWAMEIDGLGRINIFLINSYPSNTILVTSSSGIPAGTVQECFTYDGSKTAAGVILYTNGASAALTVTYNTLTGSIANTIPVQVGKRNDGSSLYARYLFDIRIWNVALTSGQISILYGLGPQ